MSNPNFKLFLGLKKSVAIYFNIPNGMMAAKIAGSAQKEIKEENPDWPMSKVVIESLKLIQNNPQKYKQMIDNVKEDIPTLLAKKAKLQSEINSINEKLQLLGHQDEELQNDNLKIENEALKSLVKIMTSEIGNLLNNTDPIFEKYNTIINKQ